MGSGPKEPCWRGQLRSTERGEKGGPSSTEADGALSAVLAGGVFLHAALKEPSSTEADGVSVDGDPAEAPSSQPRLRSGPGRPAPSSGRRFGGFFGPMRIPLAGSGLDSSSAHPSAASFCGSIWREPSSFSGCQEPSARWPVVDSVAAGGLVGC